jgi:septum formation protein
MIAANKNVILASGSPRRKELLSLVIDSFTCLSLDIDESFPSSIPAHEVAAHLAVKKAEIAHQRCGNESIVITADTTVICDDILLEKPQSEKEAAQFLNTLSNRWHEVVTAACIRYGDQQFLHTSVNKVRFASLPREAIEDYIRTGSPMDKAGGYGIQDEFGKVFIEKIEGDYQAIMGLQVSWVYKKLDELIN